MNTIKKIVILCLIITGLSCNNENKINYPIENSSKNSLLWDKAIVNDIFDLYEGDPDHPLMIRNDSSFSKLYNYLDVVLDLLSKKKLNSYDPYTDWNIFNEYPHEMDILNCVLQTCYMSRHTGKQECATSEPIKSSKDFNAIQFIEDWFFNSVDFRFTKNVISYTPIKYVEIKVLNRREVLPHFKIKVTEFNENNEPKINSMQADSEYKLLVQNVKPRIEVFENKHATGLDGRKFINIILNKVLSGEIKIYDPLYFVDFKKRPFTLDKLQAYCGCSFDSIKNEKFKLIFVEDWYFNEKNLKIKKETKGVGLIREKPYMVLFYTPFKR